MSTCVCIWIIRCSMTVENSGWINYLKWNAQFGQWSMYCRQSVAWTIDELLSVTFDHFFIQQKHRPARADVLANCCFAHSLFSSMFTFHLNSNQWTFTISIAFYVYAFLFTNVLKFASAIPADKIFNWLTN